MVSIKANAVDRFVSRPDAHITAVLVYGPDHGLVAERSRALLAYFAKDPDDPFAVSIFDDARIAKSAAPLVEDLNAIAFGSTRRTVFVRSGGGNTPTALAEAVAAPREGVLLVEAGDLKPGSAVRKAFEAAKDAAALPCYADSPGALGGLIDESLSGWRQTITPEAREGLLARLGADRLASRAEIEKLSLYCGKGAQITATDVDAATADAGELTLDALVDAIGEGSAELAGQTFERSLEAGMAPARILAAAIRHFLRLHESQAAVAHGASPERSLQALRPPVFFRRKKSHLQQLRRWPVRTLQQALILLAQAESEGRLGRLSATTTSRILLRLALLPRPKSSRH